MKNKAEKKKKKKKSLEDLFVKQIKTLKTRGCPKIIIEAFKKQHDIVIAKALEMKIVEDHIPFLPVIPKSYMGIYSLISMVRNGKKVGYSYLNPNELKDAIEVPKNPYFIFDIEDGENMIGKSPEEARTLIKKDKRLGIIVDEGIALCIHKNILNDHYIFCTGSCYGVDNVPDVCLGGDGVPRLGWGSSYNSNVKWGSASCHRRN